MTFELVEFSTCIFSAFLLLGILTIPFPELYIN